MMLTLFAAAALALVQEADPRIDALIQQLGSDEFAAREKATEELRKIGAPAHEALKKALESTDPEVRTRARALLEPAAKTRPADPPRRVAPGGRGGSIQVQSVNGDSTTKLTPADGSDPITFHRRAAGTVKLEHPDGKGGTATAESESLEKFLEEHKDLASKYGITADGIEYGGLSTSFKGGFVRGRGLELPKGFRLEDLLEDRPRRAAGASFEKVSDAIRAHFEIPEGEGFTASEVPEGSDAHAAGLRRNDLLLEIDGRKVSTLQQVRDQLRRTSTLGILRKGKRETLGPKKDF